MFSRIYTKDSDLNRVQDQIKNQFDLINSEFSSISNELSILDSKIESNIFAEVQIESVQINVSLPTVIQSKLSKPITGWLVIQKDKSATIYQSAIDDNSVSLKSSATSTNCKILLF